MLKDASRFALTLIIPCFYILQLFIIVSFPFSFAAPLSVLYLGIIIGVGGLVVWITSLIQLRRGFGVLPQKQKKITTGLYKYFDHPMYIGIWMTFVGLSFAFSSWQGLFFLTIIITPLLALRAYFEERGLRP